MRCPSPPFATPPQHGRSNKHALLKDIYHSVSTCLHIVRCHAEKVAGVDPTPASKRAQASLEPLLEPLKTIVVGDASLLCMSCRPVRRVACACLVELFVLDSRRLLSTVSVLLEAAGQSTKGKVRDADDAEGGATRLSLRHSHAGLCQ